MGVRVWLSMLKNLIGFAPKAQYTHLQIKQDHHFNWLYWSSAFESNPELSVRKLHIYIYIRGWKLLKLEARVASNAVCPLTPGSPGSDLKPMIRTDCTHVIPPHVLCEMCWCYVEFWTQITSKGGIVHHKSPAFYFYLAPWIWQCIVNHVLGIFHTYATKVCWPGMKHFHFLVLAWGFGSKWWIAGP